MQTIKLIIEYDGKITLNGEYTRTVTRAKPLVITWFAHNDLVIETEHEKIIYNTDLPPQEGVTTPTEGVVIIRPKTTDSELIIIASEQHTIFKNKLTLELAKGGDKFYMTVNEESGAKYAFPLPNSLFE